MAGWRGNEEVAAPTATTGVRRMACALLFGLIVAGAAFGADKATAPWRLEPNPDAKTWRGAPAPERLVRARGEPYGREGVVCLLRFESAKEARAVYTPAAESGDAGRADLSPYESLRFDVFVPKTPAHIHLAVYFVDEDGFYYQTRRRIVTGRNAWDVVQVDLSPRNGGLDARGHGRPWGPYVARGVREFGIAAFSDRPTTAEVALGALTFVPRTPVEGVEPQEIINFEVNRREVPRYGKFEVSFELSRAYENPFDPSEIEIIGAFETPSGKTVRVPGFFYQGYTRTMERRMERLIPSGAPQWKVRFALREVGRYEGTLEIRDSVSVMTAPLRFECVPSDAPGYVVVCEEDPRYFEFEEGEFFYPIGMNIPATFNAKGAAALGVEVNMFEGTFAYDRYLEGMADSLQNYARIWLASWSFGLEWSRDYHPAYRDLGRYNLENAWRFDHVLAQAAERDIYIQLALTTFGHWRQSGQFEGDWDKSPYNVANGGLLRDPREFWDHAEAQRIYQRMVRYAMARWGYSRHIAAWELSNEIDLVTNYKPLKPAIAKWHRDCVETIREFDPNPHLVTTNFAVWQHEPEFLRMPEIQFSSTNHYNVHIIEMMREKIFPDKWQFRKPAIMAECGYDFKGAMPETTVRYLHLCLWSSYMTPFAGAGLSWWWDFIEDRNLYPMFKPLAQYARGEDRRGRNLEMGEGALFDSNGRRLGELNAITLQNDRSGYAWIYERRLQRSEASFDFDPPAREGVTLQIRGFSHGAYEVEYWDTREGRAIKRLTSEVKDGTLSASVPRFVSDVAVKIRKVKPTGVASRSPADSEPKE